MSLRRRQRYLLEQFRRTGDELAVVVDEHDGIEGIVTMADLTEAVIGDLGGDLGPTDDRPRIVPRTLHLIR